MDDGDYGDGTSSAPSQFDDLDRGLDDITENPDVELLKRLVLNERASPDILPFDERVIGELKAIVENQQESVDEMNEDVDQALAGSLYQMEIDRVKFMLASYVFYS